MTKIESGHLLISPQGRVRVVRSRTVADNGWNCNDGAPIDDVEADDSSLWTAYTAEELASALEVAAQVRGLSDEPLMAGGIRTWDACSGRPCVLPKLAEVSRTAARSQSVTVSH